MLLSNQLVQKMSEVKKCTCQHECQDELYGKGMRVHTKCNKGDRCTVCATVSGNPVTKPTKSK